MKKLVRKLRGVLLAIAVFYAFIFHNLLLLRYVDPPFTAVHLQRRVESLFQRGKYRKMYVFVPISRISVHFQRAVIAAEDSRFYQHHGFDWREIQDAVTDDLEEGRLRGASTISQQLVKNLFLTTRGSFLRKGIEFTIVPMAELVLGKRRILELYLNVIEWGPGVYGAEAAARSYYKTSAARLDRERSARLAAVLPSPRRRHPARMHQYSATILNRMSQMGW